MNPTVGSLLLSCFALLFLPACQKEDSLEDLLILESEATTPSASYANVPMALWDYFHQFEQEAADRGRSIDLNALNISAAFEEITEDGVAGTCTYGSHAPGYVVIDQTFWNSAPNIYKEMIVFHELGHCALFLDHREGVNVDGTCKSIMRSGLGDCRDNYNLSTRSVYLDELFGSGN